MWDMFTENVINERLKNRLASYDQLDLLQKNAAYQLLPDNANKIVRFELMANYITSNRYEENKPNIAKSNLRNIYKTELKEIELREDPFEQMFTNSIIFYGGNYVVLSGISENGVLVLQSMLNGIFKNERIPGFEKFYEKVKSLSMFFLSVSNLICERANLQHAMKSSVRGKDVELPQIHREVELIKAVTFNETEIEYLRNKYNLDKELLNRISVNFGDISLENFSSDNHELNLKIFTKCKDLYVVNLPTALIGTLRHLIVCLAVEYNFERNLAELFKESLWVKVVRGAHMLDCEYLPHAITMEENHNIKDGLFQIDVDKLIYVLMVTDDFFKYDITKPFDFIYHLDTSFIDERISSVRNILLNDHMYKGEVLSIILLQQAGRGMGIGFNNYIDDELGLTMNVEDFIIFTHLEAGDSLALYKYAKAYNSQDIHNVGFLDAYSIFVENDHSFYISDESTNSIIFIPNGECRDVVEKFYEKINPHGVEMPNNKGVIEVLNIYNDANIPIYSSLYNENMISTFFVENNSGGIWVGTKELGTVSFKFVDAVAYWLWQFEPTISPFINNIIEIELKFDDINIWGTDTTVKPTEIKCETIKKESKIVVTLPCHFSNWFLSNDNKGERLLIETILRALFSLFEETIDELTFNKQFNLIAPLGPKKKIIYLTTDNTDAILLAEGQFPPVRFISATDENLLLDEIGKSLSSDGRYEIGEIQKDNAILNDAVGILYQKLKMISENISNPVKAIRILMLEYEGLLKAKEEKKLTLITAMHCFSNKDSYLVQMKKDMEDTNKLSVSLRFLIEYLGTCLPFINGTKPFSKGTRDELLVIVAQMIQMANYSDIIKYKLSDIKVSLLPSQRIGFGKRQHYLSANTKFLTDNALESFESVNGYFHSLWADKEENISIENDEELLAAFKSEFGISFNAFYGFIAALIDIGIEMENEVKRFNKNDLAKRLKDGFSLDPEDVNKALQILTLQQRKDFLKVPKGYSKEDAYPWKFNRSLSYLRKPLIKEGDAILWTVRHLYTIGYHLLSLCRGGRLRATSQLMKEYISKCQQNNGNDFNDAVYELFDKEGLIVDARVKKFGKKRITDHQGNDLGDIDVLVIEPNKRIILLLECKDLSIARNAYEIHYEMKELFEGTDKKRSIIERHSRRHDWIRSNLELVLDKYGLKFKNKWTIKPKVIISEAMVSPHLSKEKQKVNVVPLVRLVEEINTGKIFRK